ncbi:cytochrome C oxidase subunit I [Streptomyces broussonetiae]|uniref:Cytochrome C oxidase subunit I n=1 Tax=Streptomyces broussonetiae TaxID=2686304 RepID=A0A6I6NA85_9ACTN|nr:cytochrome C oxidase subunit I [Streptomyces broussonetiae]QHA05855.1 cytochrome C oxidase subunit I [Streptomyces broussonetiae]
MSGPPRQEADNTLADEAAGYLLWQARVAEAERRAREFTGPLDWLTSAQREEIERRHISDGLARARADLERIAARCASLRAEYEHRYRELKRRCLAVTLVVCAGCTAVATLLFLL